jgi:D-arabinose 1-dehydrogenase-like Zn-dependent alcohol dehydrogenase
MRLNHVTSIVTNLELLSQINEAFARLESGKARYRIVLDADF